MKSLEWDEMFLIFLYEESFFKFLLFFLDSKKKGDSIDLAKNTKHLTETETIMLNKFIMHKELSKELKERTDSINSRKNETPRADANLLNFNAYNPESPFSIFKKVNGSNLEKGEKGEKNEKV